MRNVVADEMYMSLKAIALKVRYVSSNTQQQFGPTLKQKMDKA